MDTGVTRIGTAWLKAAAVLGNCLGRSGLVLGALLMLGACAASPVRDTTQPLPPVRFLLTFDDGPSAEASGNPTSRILDTLAHNPTQPGIKAVFFVQTRWNGAAGSTTGRALALRAVAEGHELALHSGSAKGHLNHVYMSATEFEQSIADGVGDLQRLTGQTPALVRPPYWAFRQRTLDTYSRAGLAMLLTDLSARDGVPGSSFQADPATGGPLRDELTRFRERLSEGRVTLVDGVAPIVVTFHDTNAYTAERLADYLATLVRIAREEGLTPADPPYFADQPTLRAAAVTRRATGMDALADVPWPWRLLWALGSD